MKETNTNQNAIDIKDVANEVVVTIRCLSAIPAEVEALLNELALQEVAAQEVAK